MMKIPKMYIVCKVGTYCWSMNLMKSCLLFSLYDSSCACIVVSDRFFDSVAGLDSICYYSEIIC